MPAKDNTHVVALSTRGTNQMDLHTKISSYELLMLHSETLECQVLVQPHDSLLPEKNERRLMHSLDSFVDKLDSVPKCTANVSNSKMYLRFGCFEVTLVLVLLLVVVEEKLTRRC